MQGDFSRLRYNRAKHYTSVLQQQGRVALDADANEQCAINEEIRDTETIDIVGPFGGPIGDAGFAISVSGNSIQIGAGRYYVEGLLCESAVSLGYTQQPHLINPPTSDAQLLSGLQRGTSSAIQLFLEVWQRLITSLDDPCLLEPALGRADTTARLQTVWRVVATAIAPVTAPSTPSVPTNLIANDISLSQVNVARLASAANLATVATTTTGVAAAGATLNTGATAPASTAPPPPPPPPPAQPDCCVTMYAPQLQIVKGKMGAQTSGSSSNCGCQPTPSAGYTGLENQLYRVEIHKSGTAATATFKWSRENASVVVAVASVSGNQVQVDSLGYDANLGFAGSQWVEISDDTNIFGVQSNQPGNLYQIQSIPPGQLSVNMTSAVSAIDPSRNPRMRRWDQFGASASANGIPISTTGWTELENGIQIQFTAGFYATGDYWLIPARTATGNIDWPPCGGDGQAFQPAHEINFVRAPLACIHWGQNQQFAVEDCRRLFPPLTSLVGGASSALHVASTNWNNDDVLAFDQLLAQGLTLVLDQAATSRIDASIFTLMLEPPVVSPLEQYATLAKLAPIVLRTAMPLDGQITVNATSITWNLPFRDASGAINPIQLDALAALDIVLLQGINYSSFARARVRLRGADIFSGTGSSQAFLDGQIFGAAGVRADGVTPRMALTFPSGSGSKASDFESWFFLAPTLTLVSVNLSVATVAFTPTAPNPAAPTATVTVNYPAPANTTITLSVIPPPGAVAAASVPASVVIPRGQTVSSSFTVTVKNTGTVTSQSFQIVASLTNALGITGTVSANLAITGFVVINIQ